MTTTLDAIERRLTVAEIFDPTIDKVHSLRDENFDWYTTKDPHCVRELLGQSVAYVRSTRRYKLPDELPIQFSCGGIGGVRAGIINKDQGVRANVVLLPEGVFVVIKHDGERTIPRQFPKGYGDVSFGPSATLHFAELQIGVYVPDDLVV